MEKNIKKTILRNKRRKKIRSKISGTSDYPRLSIFKSLKYVQVQLIDDTNGVTLLSHSTQRLGEAYSGEYAEGFNKVRQSYQLGIEIAKLCAEKEIKKVKFDRGGFRYHGRVKAVADGVRNGGVVC